jgi:carbon monoxide dehydrogenase subunit G
MSRETLEREFVVNATPTEVWANLVDVPRVAAWLPYLNTIVEKERLVSYSAILEDKVGPFSLRADLKIDVTNVDENALISVVAAGEDRAVRSRITIHAELHVSERDDQSSDVRIRGTYEITGKVATLGAGLIKSKARKMVDEFCEAATAGLAT